MFQGTGMTPAFERRAVEKATSQSEKVAQHPSLKSGYCDLCLFFTSPSTYFHPVPKVPPRPAMHYLESPHVANAFLFNHIPMASLGLALGKLSDSGHVKHIPFCCLGRLLQGMGYFSKCRSPPGIYCII